MSMAQNKLEFERYIWEWRIFLCESMPHVRAEQRYRERRTQRRQRLLRQRERRIDSYGFIGFLLLQCTLPFAFIAWLPEVSPWFDRGGALTIIAVILLPFFFLRKFWKCTVLVLISLVGIEMEYKNK